MDRATTHMSAKVAWLIEEAGGLLMYLPVNGHEVLNPMDDTLFAQVQREYAKHPNGSEDEINRAIKAAVSTISPEQVEAAIQRIYFPPKK